MSIKSRQLGFKNSKSIHSIRRTLNSYLREDGASAAIAGSVIGNTPEVNDNHYTYDVGDMLSKQRLVESATSKILCGHKLYQSA